MKSFKYQTENGNNNIYYTKKKTEKVNKGMK